MAIPGMCFLSLSAFALSQPTCSFIVGTKKLNGKGRRSKTMVMHGVCARLASTRPMRCVTVAYESQPRYCKASPNSRYSQDQLSRLYNQTIGIDFFLKRFVFSGTLNVTLQVWDIGCQSFGGKMLDKYIYGSNGIVFVCDVTNSSSFDNLEDWLAVIKKVFASADKLPHVALMGNKIDLERLRRTVKVDKHHKFALDNSMSSHFVSAKSGDSVNLCRKKVTAEILGVRLTRPELELQQTVVKANLITCNSNEGNATWSVP